MPNLAWKCQNYAGNTYVMVQVNVIFDFGIEKLSHRVGVGGLVVLAENKEWLVRAIQ